MEKPPSRNWGKLVRMPTETHNALNELRTHLDAEAINKISIADAVAYLLKFHRDHKPKT